MTHRHDFKKVADYKENCHRENCYHNKTKRTPIYWKVKTAVRLMAM